MRSVFELEEKLITHKYDAQDIELVIQELKDKKLLDDRQFAHHYISDKSEFAKRGRYRLGLELRKKGIAQDIIEEALSQLKVEDELRTARELLKSKERFWQSLEPAKKYLRQVSLLQRRGYSIGVIKEAIKKEA
jgi:regulatory protein